MLGRKRSASLSRMGEDMPIALVRIFQIAWRFRWVIVATLGLAVAQKFMPTEAARQAWATIDRFSWILLACFVLYAAAQFFQWRKEVERLKGRRD